MKYMLIGIIDMLIGAEDMLTFSIIVLYVHGLATNEILIGTEDTLTGYR